MENANEQKRMFTWVSKQTHTKVKVKAAINQITIEEYLRQLICRDLEESK
jgi:hypothetical protein